ncbi:hypothetical protein EI94DRAFT_1772973 [Lactarius quietus]|nr:hypothetical protein EI94DRAFT_1772973 [Lactarius quietus]
MSATQAGADVLEPDDHKDSADQEDADTLEALLQDLNTSDTIHPHFDPPDADLGLAPTPECDTACVSVVNYFPSGHAGAPVPGMPCGSSVYEATRDSLGNSLWAPFGSQCDWEFTHWAKMRGPMSTAVTELLAMPEVVNKLGLSYSTSGELNKIVDTLHSPPPFEAHKLVIGGETLLFHCHDIMLCVKGLFGNPAFADQLIFAPERHYTDSGCTCQVYNELHTGDWWWSSSLETLLPGTTIILILLSSDKTQLTLFCGKPSRSAQLLVGYIPTSKLEGIANKAGIVMMGGDGIWRRCHPILASFIGDYPEQALVTCMYQGCCPKCIVPSDQLGVLSQSWPQAHISPIWQGLPFANIFDSITPDVLHQLLQGVMKHLLQWLTNSAVFGAAEINAQCRAMPPTMCHILLGLITDILLPGGQVASRVVRSTRTFLDFTFLAHLEDSLAEFHDNKDIFIDVGVRDNFNLPKLHSLLHYGPSIALFGTTDNYNSEQMERLHIKLPKKGYQKMMNHAAYIKWRQQDNSNRASAHTYTPNERMAKNPTLKAVTFNKLSAEYGMVDFQDCLADFIAKLNYPGALAAMDTLLPFRTVPVFHRIKFMTSHDSDNTDFCDGMIIWPKHIDTHARKVPLRFDTVVVWGEHNAGMHTNNGHQIAQVRVVFQIPNKVILNVFPSSDTTFHENSLLYRVSRLIHCEDHVQRPSTPPFWTSCAPRLEIVLVLNKCNTFYVNLFSDRHNYLLFSRISFISFVSVKLVN